MTNKMAIRFEQPRDETSLWSLAAACTAFAAAGGPDDSDVSVACNRKFALDSGEDLERNSSSASPDDCFSDLQQADNFNGRLSIGSCSPDIPIQPLNLLPSVHPSVETILNYNLSQQSTIGACELSKSSLKHEKHTQRSSKYKEMQEGSTLHSRTSPSTSHAPGLDDQFSRQAQQNRVSSDQNGVTSTSDVLGKDDLHPNSPNTVHKKRNILSKHSRTKVNNGQRKGNKEVEKNNKNGGGTSVQTSNRLTMKACKTDFSAGDYRKAFSARDFKKVTECEQTDICNATLAISEKFGESDAAEALLNLFTAVPQTSTKEVTTVNPLERCGDSNNTAQDTLENTEQEKSYSCPDDTNPQNNNDESKSNDHVCVQGQCEQSSVNILSRFHFKKAICRKFAESMDQDNERVATETKNSVNDALQCTAALQSENENGAAGVSGLLRPETDDDRTVVPTKTISDSVVLNFKHNPTLKNHKYKLETIETPGNKSTERKVFKPDQRPNKVQNATKHVHQSAKSNLYRISSTLGSSSESLCASDDDDHALTSYTDSSGLYSSSSEDDDSQHSDDDNSTKNATNLKLDICHDAKRRFVLSKPKFSLPVRVEPKQTTTRSQFVAGTAATTRLPFLKTESRAFAPTRTQSDNLFSRADAPSPKDKHCIGNATRGISNQKQNNHIKQAIFKFHSSVTSSNVEAIAGKPDQHGKKKTQNETSECLQKESLPFCLGDEMFTTKYDTNNNNSQTHFSGPGNSNNSKTASVFAAYQGGASFKTLSVERSHSMYQHVSPTSKATLSYDKSRLPQPTARSPALEAKQLKMQKPGRKRKVSKALNFASSTKALRTTRDKASAEECCNNEPKMIKCEKTPNSRLHHDVSLSKYWKDLSVDNAYNASSSRSSSLETYSSESVTSSSRTSSLAGDDPVGTEKDLKSVKRMPVNQTHGSKTSRRNLARNLKRSAPRNKRQRNASPETALLNNQDSKSPNDPLAHLVKLPPDDVLSANCRVTDFRLLSCFPTPASLTAGPARGELLPCPGSSVSRIPTGVAAFRWSKGLDVRELKQKRQRERWRHLTLDMFCMGASHR